ncbi:hypothetical protein TNCV_2590261 [Trichonephila clavipes]|nr:hypothetical protein TNCV_2590261 [Trichonephila clavipes]
MVMMNQSVKQGCFWIKESEENDIILTDTGGSCEVIDILIGADVIGKMLTGRRKVLLSGLVPIETYLGWTFMVIEYPIQKYEFAESFKERLLKSFYLDNVVTSVDSKDQLNEFIANSKTLMAKGGFDLREWEWSGDCENDSKNENQLNTGFIRCCNSEEICIVTSTDISVILESLPKARDDTLGNSKCLEYFQLSTLYSMLPINLQHKKNILMLPLCHNYFVMSLSGLQNVCEQFILFGIILHVPLSYTLIIAYGLISHPMVVSCNLLVTVEDVCDNYAEENFSLEFNFYVILNQP